MIGKTTKAYMILDLQFGSTGKGLLAGYLANLYCPDTIVTAWGPNAGHTYIDTNGREYIHRMLGNGIVSPGLKRILIGPGSVIDPDILLKEITSCRDLLEGKVIVIHPHAAVVLPEHLETEKAMVSIGSTMKGTGAAVVQRIMRDPNDSNVAKFAFPQKIKAAIEEMGIQVWSSAYAYEKEFDAAEVIQIEGAQGYSLSIYHGLYPFCTSRDVTPAQVMADCAIPFGIIPEVIGTLRTFPIRVANRFNEDGEMIGTSGPGYMDQQELDWDEIGIEPELTTVTKLPRRIFSFSMIQMQEAVRQCGVSRLFLNFANYMKSEDLNRLVTSIEETTGVRVHWTGHGPNHQDVKNIIPNIKRIRNEIK